MIDEETKTTYSKITKTIIYIEEGHTVGAIVNKLSILPQDMVVAYNVTLEFEKVTSGESIPINPTVVKDIVAIAKPLNAKINAIKTVRDIYDCGLLVAKQAIDEQWDKV